MSTTTDDREQVTLECEECGKEIVGPAKGPGNAGWRMGTHKASHRRAREKAGEAADGAGRGSEQPPSAPLAGGTPGAEVPPTRPRRSLGERIWGQGAKKDEPGALEGKSPAPKGRERQPARPTPRRLDTSEFWERVWSSAGRLIERRFDRPVGRAFQLEAGAAGGILEETVKGTAFDRPAQWAVRNQQAGEKLGALFGLPFLIGIIERQPLRFYELAPFLEDALLLLGPEMFKATERQERKRKDFAKAMAGAGPALGLPEGTEVTVDHVVEWMLPGLGRILADAQAQAAAAQGPRVAV